MATIYGVETNKKITPLLVRHGLEECFFQAHCEDTGLGDNPQFDGKSYCSQIINKAFQDTQGDFDHPTKESLISAVEYLANFSSSFRKPKIIEKHRKQILKLINLLP